MNPLTNEAQYYTILPVPEHSYDEVVTLWEASVRATHHFLAEEDIQFFKPLIRNQYLAAVNLYGIKKDGGYAGFMGLSAGAVEMLFIHPDARGAGIGKALLQYAIANCACNRVDVNEQNEQAVGFYRRMGFAVTGRSERDGLGKPYPLLHMQLPNA